MNGDKSNILTENYDDGIVCFGNLTENQLERIKILELKSIMPSFLKPSQSFLDSNEDKNQFNDTETISKRQKYGLDMIDQEMKQNDRAENIKRYSQDENDEFSVNDDLKLEDSTTTDEYSIKHSTCATSPFKLIDSDTLDRYIRMISISPNTETISKRQKYGLDMIDQEMKQNDRAENIKRYSQDENDEFSVNDDLKLEDSTTTDEYNITHTTCATSPFRLIDSFTLDRYIRMVSISPNEIQSYTVDQESELTQNCSINETQSFTDLSVINSTDNESIFSVQKYARKLNIMDINIESPNTSVIPKVDEILKDTSTISADKIDVENTMNSMTNTADPIAYINDRYNEEKSTTMEMEIKSTTARTVNEILGDTTSTSILSTNDKSINFNGLLDKNESSKSILYNTALTYDINNSTNMSNVFFSMTESNKTSMLSKFVKNSRDKVSYSEKLADSIAVQKLFSSNGQAISLKQHNSIDFLKKGSTFKSFNSIKLERVQEDNTSEIMPVRFNHNYGNIIEVKTEEPKVPLSLINNCKNMFINCKSYCACSTKENNLNRLGIWHNKNKLDENIDKNTQPQSQNTKPENSKILSTVTDRSMMKHDE